MSLPNAVVIVDGPDPDNWLCVVTALRCSSFNVVAVIVTGRPVSAAMPAPRPYVANMRASRAVRRDNALRAKGLCMRHGGDLVPVFEGGRAPFSTVPHDMHIKERVTDIFDDAHAGHELAGNLEDAVAYLSECTTGPLHIICGGPMTDLAYLIKQPVLFGRFGIATAQLGSFGFGNVSNMAGAGKQFNQLADADAGHHVLHNYPNAFFLLPTDITKQYEHGFDHPDELSYLVERPGSAADEIVQMYHAAWPVMWEPRGERIFVHDFHPVELMHLLLEQEPHHQTQPKYARIGRYTIASVGIGHVPHLPYEMDDWGRIELTAADPTVPTRFLVDGVDTDPHRQILYNMLNAPAASNSIAPSNA